MSNSSTQSIGGSFEGEHTRPEEFCFAVEVFDEVSIVTICPTEYFEKNGYQDDQYYDEIASFLDQHGFNAIMECSFEPAKQMTLEEVKERMLQLGFKQVPKYDEYITSTAQDFPLDEMFVDGSNSDSSGSYHIVNDESKNTLE